MDLDKLKNLSQKITAPTVTPAETQGMPQPINRLIERLNAQEAQEARQLRKARPLWMLAAVLFLAMFLVMLCLPSTVVRPSRLLFGGVFFDDAVLRRYVDPDQQLAGIALYSLGYLLVCSAGLFFTYGNWKRDKAALGPRTPSTVATTWRPSPGRVENAAMMSADFARSVGVTESNWTNDTPGMKAVPLGLRCERDEQMRWPHHPGLRQGSHGSPCLRPGLR